MEITKEMFRKGIDSGLIRVSEDIDKESGVLFVNCVIGSYELVLHGTDNYDEVLEYVKNKEKVVESLYQQYSTPEKAIENFYNERYFEKMYNLLTEGIAH